MATESPPRETLPGGVKRTGVSARLGRAFALQIAVISAAVIVGVFAIAFIVSGVLSRKALEGEAAHFWERFAADPMQPLPDTANMIGYLARNGDVTQIPDRLRAESPGFRRIEVDGARPLLYVSDGPGGRLYLVFQQQQVSDLTLYFGVIPGAFVLLLIYALSYLTYRLSQRAVSPLVRLAERLEAYRPLPSGDMRLALDDLRDGADAEVATMIEALDRFARRLEAFVLRERDFTRDASHELRTPIAVLGASLDLLERDADRPQPERACIERMRRTLTQMHALVESLLLLAREEEVAAGTQTCDVNAVVREQIDLLSDLARERGNVVNLAEDETLEVAAPSRFVAIAFGNLLRNALGYTRAGTVSVRVAAGAVTVADTGPGMSAEELGRVFEPFVRGAAAQEGGAGGHGLGLAIVRRLAMQFGWQLDVDSASGRGTRIALRFGAGVHGARMRNPMPGTVSISSLSNPLSTSLRRL